MTTKIIVRVIKPADVGTIVARNFCTAAESDVGKLIFHESDFRGRAIHTMETNDQRDARLEKIKGQEVNLGKLDRILAALEETREAYKELGKRMDHLEQSILYHTAVMPIEGGLQT